MKGSYCSLACCLLCLWACRPENETGSGATPVPEAISFDGRPLYAPTETEASLRNKDSLLAIARANFETDSARLENIVWLGRRTAYLNRYQEAIGIYSRGLERFPAAPELYRHRGHRYLSIRKPDLAITDFGRAAALVKDRPIEIEPDGLPNKLNIPLSTLQFNIWYHWALAYYLKGDFGRAAQLFEECLVFSTNPDLLVATADWLYMCYRRLGQTEKAGLLLEKINPDMEIIENQSYFNRLLLYKGLKQPGELLDLSNNDPERQLDIVTQGYGVGNWYLYQGDTTQALEIFRRILQTDYWPAFGYLAAEAELARSR